MRAVLVSLGTLTLLYATAAQAQNQPCARGAGGVVGCTADGRYKCRDGRISQSRQRCIPGELGPTDDLAGPPVDLTPDDEPTENPSNRPNRKFQ